MKIEKDFKDFLRLLNEKKVEFLIVGGFAYSFYAEPRYTKDIDIFINRSRTNAEKVAAVVDEFWKSSSGLKAEDLCAENVIVQLGYPPLRIDIITSITGVSFGNAWRKRVAHDFDGVPVFFISLADLIKNKMATGRPQDLLDGKKLSRIKRKLKTKTWPR